MCSPKGGSGQQKLKGANFEPGATAMRSWNLRASTARRKFVSIEVSAVVS
jgi:hypothetical protein